MTRLHALRPLLPFGLIGAVVASIYLTGVSGFAETRLLDLRFRLLDREVGPEIVLVTLDAESLKVLEGRPWARDHATVIGNLVDAGARKIAIDLDLDLRTPGRGNDELDVALSREEAEIVVSAFPGWTGVAGSRNRAVRLVSADITPDSDGITRSYRLRPGAEDRGMPSMAAVLADRMPEHLATFLIDFSLDPETITRIPYIDVLRGQLRPSEVEGKTVLVGSTAPRVRSEVSVPLHASVPSIVIQALAIETLNQRDALQRFPRYSVAAIALVLCLLVGPLNVRFGWRLGAFVTMVLCASCFGAALWVQANAGSVVDVVPLMLGLSLCYGYGVMTRIDRLTGRLASQKKQFVLAESLRHHIIETSFDAILTIRDDGHVESFNPAAMRMFGRDASTSDCHFSNLFDAKRTEGNRKTALHESSQSGLMLESEGRRKDGTVFPIELAITALKVAGERRRIAYIRDVTHRKTQEARLKHQATHDPLTALPNRALLTTRMEQAFKKALEETSQVAVLLLDLNGFKEINDSLGHPVGDELLQQIAVELRRPLRSTDTIARLGGDEFAVLLPRTDLDIALEVAHRLTTALGKNFKIGEFRLQVDAAIGLAMFPEHGMTPAEMIQRSDIAMYQAKRIGSGLEIYRDDLGFTSKRQLRMRSDLRIAVQEKRLMMHYQPKIDAGTGHMAGFEALMRWEHAEFGWVNPEEFIRLAEHSGLMHQLTEFALEVAMRDCAKWCGNNLALGVATNISPKNLLDDEVIRQVAQFLEISGIPCGMLTLEITESAVMEDPRRSMEILEHLHQLGVRLSIDDFGTGYSSLKYLQKLPVQEIKIDKSFVLEMQHDSSAAMIVRSTIDLAHNLGMQVVAEGVETQAVWDQLNEWGCDSGQGWMFAKAQPIEQILAWVRPAPPVEVEAEAEARDTLVHV